MAIVFTQKKDLQRVRLLQQLQAGGLTLKECQACLDAENRTPLLEKTAYSWMKS